MKSRKRPYTLKARGEQVADTRRRIAQAAMELHQELGPRQTTISAIAERAGVERLTVYRHYPDDDALFAGCSSRFLELNPAPDPTAWQRIANPAERTRRALTALYGYFARIQPMQLKLERDVDQLPALARILQPFTDYLNGIADDLASTWRPSDRTLRALARHSTRFATWQSLEIEDLSDAAKVRLVVAWLECVGELR